MAFVAGSAASQTREIPGHLLSPAPKIDGTIGEEEWAGVPSVHGLFSDIDDTPAPDGSQYWVAYDTDFIYFAARLSDSIPSQIRATEYRNNVGLGGDDSVSIMLDLGGSATDFSFFSMNARGGTSIYLSGGRAAKREWTGEFLAKGRITDSGWEVEARIPWQIFKLPGAGRRNLRISFDRYVPRLQRSYTFTKRSDAKTGRYPIWKDVAVPPQASTRSLKLLPYSYFGYDRDNAIFNSGLDMKTQLTDQMELVGSVNPDFRNIENEVLSLDFSRFERLAADTRPFFQEGADYLSSPLFASQRIDHFDVGLNLYGRLSSRTRFGLLNTTDWNRENHLPTGPRRATQNSLVGTLSHSFDPTFSLKAGIASLARPGLNNDAFFVRAGKQWGDVYISANHAASRDSVEGYGQVDSTGLTYNRRNIFGSLSFGRSDKTYNPRLGFAPDRNYQGGSFNFSHDRYYDRGAFDSWGVYFGGSSYNHLNNDFYRRSQTASLYATLRNGLSATAQASWGNFEGEEDELYSAYLSYPNGNPYRSASISYSWGRQGGLPYSSLYVSTTYRTLGRLQTDLSYQHVEFAGGADQLVGSANYDLGKDRSIAGRVVYSDGDTNFYVALKQSGNLGTEYFLILGNPNAPTFRASIILKATVPFEIPLGPRKAPRKELLSGRPRTQ